MVRQQLGRIYETNNRGCWYDFGFVMGLSGSFAGSSHSGCHLLQRAVMGAWLRARASL
jgi:hypothetical protein